MNERIKELWEQSKTSGVHPEFGEYDKYSAEKFTELIVRECSKWINDNVGLLDEEAQADLLDHFGVEE